MSAAHITLVDLAASFPVWSQPHTRHSYRMAVCIISCHCPTSNPSMASHYIQNKTQLPAIARAPIGPGPFTGSSLTFSLGKSSPSKSRWWPCPSLSGDSLTQVFACLPYLFLALCWDIIYIHCNESEQFNGFYVCSELCNHHRNLISGYFHRPQKKSCTIISSHIHSPASLSSPRQMPVYVLSLQIWLFWTFYINETIKCMVFGGWLPCNQETTPLT